MNKYRPDTRYIIAVYKDLLLLYFFVIIIFVIMIIYYFIRLGFLAPAHTPDLLATSASTKVELLRHVETISHSSRCRLSCSHRAVTNALSSPV